MKPWGDCGLVEEAEIAPSWLLFRALKDLRSSRESSDIGSEMSFQTPLRAPTRVRARVAKAGGIGRSEKKVKFCEKRYQHFGVLIRLL